jgi:hypothetical protein
MIDLNGIATRIRRLEELTRALAKEVVLWKQAHDPLLYVERRAYLKALQDGLAGLDEARVVLAQVRQRLEEAEQTRPNHVVARKGPGP